MIRARFTLTGPTGTVTEWPDADAAADAFCRQSPCTVDPDALAFDLDGGCAFECEGWIVAPAPCGWFALCDRPATGTTAHPILGTVPTCDRCAERAR